MPSVKKNFIYSSILTTANYLFPLITYPYVSRVLGVTNIGLCNFIDSIINYFSLFAAMGIGTIGIRVVAQYRNDKDKLSKAFCSLLALNAISTFIMLLLLIVATIAVPRLRENCDLMIVGAFKLIGNLFIINWFYQGLEDFKYVTLRTIMVKASYVVLIFVLIHSRNDYLVYFILSTAYFVGANALINIVHARKYVSFSLHGLNIKQYLSAQGDFSVDSPLRLCQT